jgi:hydrogenase/urease accessory protein HupE
VVEQIKTVPDSGPLRLFLSMILATLIAPLAAPASILIVISLALGDSPADLLALPFAPLGFFTVPGIYGYVAAFIAVSILGTALTILTLRLPQLRPIWIWAAIGALFGILVALMFTYGFFGWLGILCGSAAGGSCALVYRLIVGRPIASR